MKFKYWKSNFDGQWYFHLVARNGQIVMASEGYKRKASVFKTMNSIRKAPIVPLPAK